MTRSTSRGGGRTRLLPVLGLLLTVALTACGSSGDDDASAAGTGGDGGTSNNGGTGGNGGTDDPEAAELEFYECMRANGVDMPDPDPGQPGIQLQLPRDDPDAEAAMEECRSLLPNGGEPPEQNAESLAALREFTACMRDNGVDMPDPSGDGSLSMPEGVDPQSAEFQAAMSECQPLLAGAPIRIGPGPGGGGR